MKLGRRRRAFWFNLLLFLGFGSLSAAHPELARGGEPAASTYWNVAEVRAGMKGEGLTVMTGTKIEAFHAEVLGVLKDVNPGRDMVLCRLSGCNLEHAGIIQGMSGSPIYIDGKLLGAVAYAWEFAKDPIAGVTPFSQMVQYVRSNQKRLAAEGITPGQAAGPAVKPAKVPESAGIDVQTFLIGPSSADPPFGARIAIDRLAAASLGGMRPIATPLALRGFTPRSIELLQNSLSPLGMAPMSGGAASAELIKAEGDKPFAPGSPMAVALVVGDFDISGIGTVTHVEGDRVYGFGHPMLALGGCNLPLMTGYIHTVYPRASVSMKMGSPLKVAGVLDADVSTCVAGRLGAEPDMMPLAVRVKVGRYSDSKTYKVKIVREPSLMSSLVTSVLANAIDTEGNLPEEFHARVSVSIKLEGREPLEFEDTLSGARFTGQFGASALFSSISAIVNVLTKNDLECVRVSSIFCDIDIAAGRLAASIESLTLATDRVEPGQTLQGAVAIRPYKGALESAPFAVAIPADLPEGRYEIQACDMTNSLRRTLRNDPRIMNPKDVAGLLRVIRVQMDSKHTTLNLHVALPEVGLAVRGESLADLPASARSVFANSLQSNRTPIRRDLMVAIPTSYVLDGSQSLRFQVEKNAGISR